MRILASSDIHLGKKSDISSTGSDSWNAVVQKAIDLKVDMLVLAGDVIERDEAWLGVYGALTSGLDRLKQAGIQVVGVGGNHDWAAFPMLARENDSIRILGLGGKWETYDYERLRIVGWSFPNQHHAFSPLSSFDASLIATGKPTLGLLHGDVGQSGSRYGSTQIQQFSVSKVDLWMLGHIHKPGKVGDSNAYYCGSPYAMDPSETGPHGVYLLETEEGDGWKEPLFLPLSPIRYEQCLIPVDGIQTLDELKMQIINTVRTYAASLDFFGDLYIKPVFVGTLSLQLDLGRVVKSLGDSEYALMEHVFLQNRWEDRTEPALDLEQLAKGRGADAVLAQYLLDEQQMELFARQYLQLYEDSTKMSTYSMLDAQKPSIQEARLEARSAALALLRAMAAQKEGGQV